MKKLLVQAWVLVALTLLIVVVMGPRVALAQAANDTSSVGPLRPRYGSYLLPPYPSPSSPRVPVTIQFYNHNPEILSVKIFDLKNSLILVLHEKQQTDRGLHTSTLDPRLLSSGMYFVRLTTYTPSGAENTIDNARFVIVH